MIVLPTTHRSSWRLSFRRGPRFLVRRASFVVGGITLYENTTHHFFALLLVSCTSTRPSASLTAEQAMAAALRLANDRAFTLYHCRPFHDGQPAQFVAGHWLWVARQGFGHGDIQATFQFAADDASHKVEVQVLDGQNLF